MSITRQDLTVPKPKLKAVFLDQEIDRIETFTITTSLQAIYTAWSFTVPNIGGAYNRILASGLHKWTPITLYHQDSLVQSNKWIPALMGVITRISQDWGEQGSRVTFSGYNLGKLLDSCGPAWFRIRNHTWQQLADALLDRSWLALNQNDWGLKGIVGINVDKWVGIGRYARVQDYGHRYGSFMPPLQIQPGERVYDTLSRYARLTGYDLKNPKSSGAFVTVAATGELMVINPDDCLNDPAIYPFNATRVGPLGAGSFSSGNANLRIMSGTLTQDGDDLYNEYECFSSVLRLPYKQDDRDPNRGKFSTQLTVPQETRVNRTLSWVDAEAYTTSFADARVRWRQKLSEYNAWTLTYNVAGHSMPGAGVISGGWIPLTSGHICEVNDSYAGITGRYIVDQVTKMQNDSQGTTAKVVIRKLGLMGV